MKKPETLPHIPSLILYEGGKPIEELQRELGLKEVVKLASNENPLGPPSSVMKFLKSGACNLALYPDGNGFYLKQKLAEKLIVKPENIVLGNGSNEILNFVGQCYLERGDEAIFSDKAFIAYRIAVEAVRGTCVIAETADDGFSHSLENFKGCISDKTKVIFIANPNNPTGNLINKMELLEFINTVPENILIVLDEAYYEYNDASLYIDSIFETTNRRNLLITRTFSKIYGIAGLRVGYAVGDAAIISALNRMREPFNINSLALKAAEIALDDKVHLERSLRLNDEGKIYLRMEFEKAGISYVETYGNFFLINVGKGVEVTRELEKKGIIVRPMAGYGLHEHLRVTIGTQRENEAFIAALTAVLNG